MAHGMSPSSPVLKSKDYLKYNATLLALPMLEGFYHSIGMQGFIWVNFPYPHPFFKEIDKSGKKFSDVEVQMCQNFMAAISDPDTNYRCCIQCVQEGMLLLLFKCIAVLT
jgi:hypothetical protein